DADVHLAVVPPQTREDAGARGHVAGVGDVAAAHLPVGAVAAGHRDRPGRGPDVLAGKGAGGRSLVAVFIVHDGLVVPQVGIDPPVAPLVAGREVGVVPRALDDAVRGPGVVPEIERVVGHQGRAGRVQLRPLLVGADQSAVGRDIGVGLLHIDADAVLAAAAGDPFRVV